MDLEQEAVSLCKVSEGLGDGDKRTPLLEPYICPAGVPTIGYGTTRYPDGRRVTMEDPPITEECAEELLQHELRESAKAVDRLITVKLPRWARAALIDFTYNLGAGALKASTMRSRINRGDPRAWEELRKWVFGGGRRLPGLVVRRAREQQLWNTGSFV